MRQIYLRSCFWGIAVAIIVSIIVVLVLFKFGLIKFASYYQDAYTSSCAQKVYLNVPALPSPADGFSKDIAKTLMGVSYNVSVSNCDNLGPFPGLEGFDVIKEIQGSTSKKTQRMFAYYLYSTASDTGILVFTGTIFMDEWIADLEMIQISPSEITPNENITVHKGFYDIYATIRQQILDALNVPPKLLYITGHSLGGALASLATLDLIRYKPIVYTFASPRSFNVLGAETIANNVSSYYRVFNTEDVIPTAPLSVSILGTYEHITSGLSFTKNLGNDSDNHTLSYLDFVKY